MPAGEVCPVRSVLDALERWRRGERAALVGGELWDVLAAVPDPRDRRGRRYSLAALLASAILAVAAGMGGYAGFATWSAHAPEEVLAGLGGAVSPAQ